MELLLRNNWLTAGGWGLLHSLWIGLLIISLLNIFQPLIQGAGWRYRVSYACMVLLALMLPLSWTEYIQNEMGVSYQDGYHSVTNASADTFRGKPAAAHALAERKDTYGANDVALSQAPEKQSVEEEKPGGSRPKEVTVSPADCAALLTALYNKGLVTQNGPFNIRYDDLSLLIDGKLQPAELYAAVASYMNRKGSTVITGTRQNLYIESRN